VARQVLIEGSIQTQTGDEGDRVFRLAATVEEFEGGVSAVGDGHDLTFGVPTPH
jgi:hypothetical protein